jgi:hypothetical protein
MRAGLAEIPGIRLLGDAAGAGDARVGLWSFDVEGVHAHDAGQFLDARGIAVRVGHHCAAPLHASYGVTASVRASTALYNTPDDVDVLLDAVSGIRPYFEPEHERARRALSRADPRSLQHPQHFRPGCRGARPGRRRRVVPEEPRLR